MVRLNDCPKLCELPFSQLVQGPVASHHAIIPAPPLRPPPLPLRRRRRPGTCGGGSAAWAAPGGCVGRPACCGTLQHFHN